MNQKCTKIIPCQTVSMALNSTLNAREVNGAGYCFVKAHDFLESSGPHRRKQG